MSALRRADLKGVLRGLRRVKQAAATQAASRTAAAGLLDWYHDNQADLAPMLRAAGMVGEERVKGMHRQVDLRASRKASRPSPVAPRRVPVTDTVPRGTQVPQAAQVPPSARLANLTARPVPPVTTPVSPIEESVTPEPVSSSRNTVTPEASVTETAAVAEEEAPTPHVFDASRLPREEKRVPASPFARVAGFAGLGAQLAFGTVGEVVKQTLSGNMKKTLDNGAQSLVLTEANADALVDTLCRMRGAALKLGQMLSIQDPATVPPQVLHILDRVRQSANMMPSSQLYDVMKTELGENWRDKFASFSDQPIAAASIGQVHEATALDGTRLAVKVQYPGVARSIDSDMWNLKQLVTVTNILPRGLYVEHGIQVMREELIAECNYHLEAGYMQDYREYVNKELSHAMQVPEYYPELSTQHVMTSSFLEGVPLDDVSKLDQATRNRVSSELLILTLKELFEWGFMQTDPSFSNYLYDPKSKKISLLDFGAAKRYSRKFVDAYIEMVHACVHEDRDRIIDASLRLGLLTGDETKEMMDAHVEAGSIIGAPFRSVDRPFDFTKQDMTQRVSQLGQVMLKHRLTPPPREAYTLHRRLSGAFLTAIRLRASVDCATPFDEIYNRYEFGLDEWPNETHFTTTPPSETSQ